MPGKERPAPEELLSIKDELVARWRQLPPEHQATMALVLVNDVSQGEWGAWLREALSRQEAAPDALSGNDQHRPVSGHAR